MTDFREYHYIVIATSKQEADFVIQQGVTASIEEKPLRREWR